MFTIRVYGLLLNNGHVLVSDEIIRGQCITKFPGGGLEFGEGLKDCLVREIREEIGLVANDLEHFYTTDFFQQSAFHATPMQVVSVYYTFAVADPQAIPVVAEPFNGMRGDQVGELFRWLPLESAKPEDLSLSIDRIVLGMITQ
ncbi:MAG: NUDIX domain-containing protein [Flavobacteriales bacterium]|nr:NUDIX domain-containing protein [Flavobacteriales bacterium]MBP6642540.1 NUDIX domain-containing protein [Flavobacteriales bacterium]MBP7155788.1 NUDIX domain-containing protein [Flavobacteriales bacterium]HQV76522.1 NUDIX domain-containing protein [Flavobacteriales bacterium]